VLEGLQRLHDLQRLDDELTALEEEHAAVPARRSRIREEREACEQRLAGAKQSLQDGDAEQRRAERELQDQEALLKRLEGQQFQVKTNEAYSALLSEMEHARLAISDCETRILESMDAIETARADLASGERERRETDARLGAEERTLEARERELAEAIAGLRKQRDELGGRLAADLLARYERIASRRRPAVVMVSKELCEGCQVDIPPQSYIEILRAERLIACGNCHRILIHQEKLSARAAS
jgi:predicted  nucleic acid-binding Zn-ribbon protein